MVSGKHVKGYDIAKCLKIFRSNEKLDFLRSEFFDIEIV